MSKPATISSLVRQAARSEAEYVSTIQQVFDEEPADRIADFFDRLNVPRSVEGEQNHAELPTLDGNATKVGSYADEARISAGMQKFLDRHLKKVKWHAQRPTLEGGKNAMLLMRMTMILTELRLQRLEAILRSKTELDPYEWAIARELTNKSYLGYRHFLIVFGGMWVDASVLALPRDEAEELLGSFYEIVDGTVRRLEQHRDRIEELRQTLTVIPPGFDPVKPPIYFGGDLMGRGPWKQFWSAIEDRAHHFREALA